MLWLKKCHCIRSSTNISLYCFVITHSLLYGGVQPAQKRLALFMSHNPHMSNYTNLVGLSFNMHMNKLKNAQETGTLETWSFFYETLMNLKKYSCVELTVEKLLSKMIMLQYT